MTLVCSNAGRDLPSFPGDMLSMQRAINRMFDTFFRGDRREDGDLFPSAWRPAADLVEQANDFVVKMDMPGVDRKDVKITMQQNVLTIRGEKKQELMSKESNAHRLERSWGSFQRSFTFPSGVNTGGIEATFIDGILTVTVPKAEAAKPQQIDVKVR